MNARTTTIAVLGAVSLTAGVMVAQPEKRLVNLEVQDGGQKVCVIPDCRTLFGRGAWDETQEVDCRATGVLGLPDGGPRWRGCVVTPAELSVGSSCLHVSCDAVPMGLDPTELR
jgi:hypothetical protein